MVCRRHEGLIVKKMLNWIFIAVCWVGLSAFAQAQDLAGSVLIVIGDAQVTDAKGASHALTRGEKVYAGQSIATGANGHVNLRMVDGAAVIVRASSRLKIEEYFVDTVTPSKSRIKLNLENGVVRSITGKAGEASKESYRLNTPLAAIGIRGTDFVVQANNEVTRVLVQSGAIVMTPLSADCSRDSLGPCKSATSRDLTAAMRNAYLELRSRADAPVFVPAEKAIESPNLIAPPRQDEPRVGGDKGNNKASAVSQDFFVADAKSNSAVGDIKNQVSSTTKPDVPVVTPTVPQKIWWGRWEEYANGDSSKTVQAVRSSEREVSSSNPVFGLLREKTDEFALPNEGVVSFKLADSESYLVNLDKTLTSATVTSPSLTIDFANRKYNTALTVNVPGISPVGIQSQGSITFQGYFISESNSPSTNVDGTLNRDGSQAGYLFQRFLNNGTSVVGATRWIR
ncbi:MAG: hypothetical protein E6Q34_05950 [Burkholderiaceae bacterium]|nr:MAG: hypothetical protein E6Q34_05950 [Burkholderiaceae bacterium]